LLGFWSAVRRSAPLRDDPDEVEKRNRSHADVQSIKLLLHGTRELTLDEAVVAVTVVDPNVATAETTGERVVLVKGLAAGETALIISGKSSRSTYLVQIMRPPRAATPRAKSSGLSGRDDPLSGYYALHFSPGFNASPSLIRHDFAFAQKLSGSRALRASGELFNFIGRGGRTLAQPLGTGFGANRITLGLDSPDSRFDALDSELDVSRLSFVNYTMRGAHFVSTPGSRWRGAELFAGAARPQPSFFNEGEGLLAGAFVPVLQDSGLRVRAGAFFISPRRRESARKGGLVFQTEARYAPNAKTNAEAEAAYANGGLSWRTRLDLQLAALDFHGELFRLDPRSPLVGIGAQTVARETKLFSLRWQPAARFAASLGYNRTTNFPSSTTRRAELNSRTLTATVAYAPARGTRFGFSFKKQEIETPTSIRTPFTFDLRTSAATFKYDQSLGRRLANDLEARLTLSDEGNTGERLARGFSLREQLRYSWRRGSVAGFVNYRSNTPSLTGLVLRNPSLLPAESRAAFAADPALFLLLNRDALPRLLPEVDLPVTRNTEIGARLQSAFSRLHVAAEVRYGAGDALAHNDRSLLATFSADLKLDAANSIQVSGARASSFNTPESRTSVTVSYVHRFGAESGGGFQFSKLLGLSRGRIQGRVFYDLNGDGQDDAGEPGAGGMRVELDGGHVQTTDARGRFGFGSLAPGEHSVALVSGELGVSILASNDALRRLVLPARGTLDVSFGVTNFGFAAGQVFNDLFLSGAASANGSPGVDGVRVLLRPASSVSGNAAPPLATVVSSRGTYEFRHLRPGSYLLEIDPASIPADFRQPEQKVWTIAVNPLRGSILDLPLVAQRAVSGVVFIDTDADGKFDPNRDEVVEGATVMAGCQAVRTNRQGAYILRNLPAGATEVTAYAPRGRKGETRNIELGVTPAYVKNLDLAIGVQ
jgi:hypothetical protein